MFSVARTESETTRTIPEIEPDRLAHAKNFANELSDFRLREIKLRWTDERRAQKAALIRHQQPWRKATGPKTEAGKARSSLNAFKDPLGGSVMRVFSAWMGMQRRFLRRVEKVTSIIAFLHSRGFVTADTAIHTLMQNSPETLDQILRRMRLLLAGAGIENPVLDSRILVRQGGNFSDSDLISDGQTPLSNQVIENIEKLVARRIAGEPVSRVLGEREFWGMPFRVTPDTLDPRPDTETLVEAALKTIPNIVPSEEIGLAAMASSNTDGGLRILDLGTGSGCILISLLKELPHATGVGIDLNPGAVAVARQNADANGVGSRVEFRAGSWFEPLLEDESFDLIVSNPPYIPESDIESLAVEVRNHDPRLALTGGADGLDAYKMILKKMKKYLSCGGRALFEIGRGQEADLARLVDESNMRVCDSYRDLAGVIRVVEIGCGEK